jgi:hypothetical protein
MVSPLQKDGFRYLVIWIAIALLTSLFVAITVKVSFASSSGILSASTNVPAACFISIQPNSISFGVITPGSNLPTNQAITDNDVNGNVAANIIVSGSDWSDGGVNSFGVTNTVWSPSTSNSYTGTPLTSVAVDTGITIPIPSLVTPITGNTLYFGLAIPISIVPAVYSQSITITNSC